MEHETVNTYKTETLTASDDAGTGNETSKIELLKKAARMVSSQGAAFTLRRAIWRLHFERFERRREALSRKHDRPSNIQFLGHEFELHQSNEGVSEELRILGMHEPSATAAYLEKLFPGDHVLDVGSKTRGITCSSRRKRSAPPGVCWVLNPPRAFTKFLSVMSANPDTRIFRWRRMPWALRVELFSSMNRKSRTGEASSKTAGYNKPALRR